MMYNIECIEHINNRIKISIENLETNESTGTLDLTQEDARELYLTLHNYFQQKAEKLNKKSKDLYKDLLILENKD